MSVCDADSSIKKRSGCMEVSWGNGRSEKFAAKKSASENIFSFSGWNPVALKPLAMVVGVNARGNAFPTMSAMS